MTVKKSAKHTWAFAARLRRHAYGWRSSRLAVTRVKAAVAEIEAVSRKNPTLAAEGAVIFFEKVSPALEQVDSSSGALGSAVGRAIEALVEVFIDGARTVDPDTRGDWLERLWEAHQEDDMPYIETLADFWGELCGSPEVSAVWADRLLPVVITVWTVDRKTGGYFKGTSACLSCLITAGRHQELLDLLEHAPHHFWHDRKFGARALAAMGRPDEAIQYAESCIGLNCSVETIASECEGILLAGGHADEAYARYAFPANETSTHLATFRAILKKYPHKAPAEILRDAVARSRGNEGKWFAAAKDFGLLDEAIALARKSPCDPRTLTRASRDFGEKNPAFAVEAGLAALGWLADGYGYEMTGADVLAAFSSTMKAAENAGRAAEVVLRIRQLLSHKSANSEMMTRLLDRFLGPQGGDAA